MSLLVLLLCQLTSERRVSRRNAALKSSSKDPAHICAVIVTLKCALAMHVIALKSSFKDSLNICVFIVTLKCTLAMHVIACFVVMSTHQ